MDPEVPSGTPGCEVCGSACCGFFGVLAEPDGRARPYSCCLRFEARVVWQVCTSASWLLTYQHGQRLSLSLTLCHALGRVWPLRCVRALLI